jgi:hypothetical protein
MYAVVVVEDSADVVREQIADHEIQEKPSRTPTKAEMDAALKRMEKLSAE